MGGLKVNNHNNLCSHIFDVDLDFNKTAYCFNRENISYGQLQEITARIAKLMLDMKINSGDRVLMFLNDTPALVACFLAAKQIGAIPIALNPKSKQNYLSHYIVDSGAALIVCEYDNFTEVDSANQSVIGNSHIIVQDLFINDTIDLQSIKLSDALELSMHNEYYSVDDDTVTFWQYTSGTTGMPKAVKHKASGLLHLNQVYARDLLKIDSNSRIYSTAKTFFGYGLGNTVFFCLLNGATAILDERWPNETIVSENILSFQPTHLFSVPNFYAALLKLGETLGNAVSEIDFCVSAGSALSRTIFVSWQQRYGVELIDGIGATEMCHIFLSNRPGEAKISSTGFVLPGYEVKLLESEKDDKFLEGQKPSIQGELCVKGPSVSVGYHNNTSKTNESFKRDWYHTGDIFKKLDNGDYQYLGRKGDIFKSKGRWVVPQNFEEFIIANFKDISEVVLLPSNDADPKPVMCYVRNESKLLGKEKLNIKSKIKEYVGEAFESHYYPSEFRELKAFPRNANGKVLRNEILQQTQNTN